MKLTMKTNVDNLIMKWCQEQVNPDRRTCRHYNDWNSSKARQKTQVTEKKPKQHHVQNRKRRKEHATKYLTENLRQISDNKVIDIRRHLNKKGCHYLNLHQAKYKYRLSWIRT